MALHSGLSFVPTPLRPLPLCGNHLSVHNQAPGACNFPMTELDQAYNLSTRGANLCPNLRSACKGWKRLFCNWNGATFRWNRLKAFRGGRRAFQFLPQGTGRGRRQGGDSAQTQRKAATGTFRHTRASVPKHVSRNRKHYFLLIRFLDFVHPRWRLLGVSMQPSSVFIAQADPKLGSEFAAKLQVHFRDIHVLKALPELRKTLAQTKALRADRRSGTDRLR